MAWPSLVETHDIISNFSNSDFDGIFGSSLQRMSSSKGNVLQYDYAFEI